MLELTDKSTKERIISILGEQWPLGINKIKSNLTKKGKRVTYQAIHQFLGELQLDGVVIKKEKEYMLNPVWISKVSEKTNKLLENYSKKSEEAIMPIEELNFKSLTDALDFALEKANSGYFGQAEKCYVQSSRLFLFPLSESQSRNMHEFCRKTKTVLICKRNTPIEKICAGFLSNMGIETHLGIPCATPTNVTIIGKSIVSLYIFYSDHEDKGIDTLYRGKRFLGQDIFEKFSAVMRKKIRVKLIINRNEDIYNDVLRQTLKLL